MPLNYNHSHKETTVHVSRPVTAQLLEQNVENIGYFSKVLKSQNCSWIIWIIQQLVFKPSVSQSAVGRITRGDGQVKEEVIYSSGSVKSLLQLQTDTQSGIMTLAQRSVEILSAENMADVNKAACQSIPSFRTRETHLPYGCFWLYLNSTVSISFLWIPLVRGSLCYLVSFHNLLAPFNPNGWYKHMVASHCLVMLVC